MIGNNFIIEMIISEFHWKWFNLKYVFSIRLLQILSFVCNNTQPGIQFRDACYGCFLRSVSLPAGPPQLIGISQCSSVYLFNSTYQICGQGLAVKQNDSQFIMKSKPMILNEISFRLLSSESNQLIQSKHWHAQLDIVNSFDAFAV